MNRKSQESFYVNKKHVSIYFLFINVFSLGCLIYLLLIPTDAKNAIFLGYSLYRLIMAFFLLSPLILGIFISVCLKWEKAKRIITWINKKTNRKYLAVAFGVAFIFATVIILIPEYQIEVWVVYLQRAKPIIIWLMLVGGTTFFSLIYINKGKTIKKRDFSHDILEIALFFAALLLISLIIVLTKLGLIPDKYYWNANGIPILSSQVWFSIFISFTFTWFIHRIKSKGRQNNCSKKDTLIDVSLFLTIWGIAATTWILTSQARTSNGPGPYPPNYEFYPFRDSFFYDISAEFALIGQNFSNGQHISKPFLTQFLFFIHQFSGGDFGKLINLQVMVLATIPAFLFLIGKSLHKRITGIFMACLSIFQERNAFIATLWLSTSHSKLLLSEVPTALLMIILALLMINWVKNYPRNNKLYLTAMGGLLGLLTLLRHNTWLLVPIPIVLILVVSKKNWKKFVLGVLLMVFAFFITISPWMWRTNSVLGNPYYFMGSLRSVVWKKRYHPEMEDSLQYNTLEKPELNNGEVNNLDKVSELDVFSSVKKFIPFISNHFLHNIVTSFAILPYSLQLDDLEHAAKNSLNLFPSIIGQPINDATVYLLLIINLFIFSIGIHKSWKKWKIAGLIPLIIYAVYNLALAIARTSGGRYIVPIEWVIYTYYGIGIICLVQLFLQPIKKYNTERLQGTQKIIYNNLERKSNYYVILLILAFFFFTVASIPIIENFTAPKYKRMSKDQLISEINNIKTSPNLNIDIDLIGKFSNYDNSILIKGRALYPRFYCANQGEPSKESFLCEKKYSRLTFSIINSDGVFNIILKSGSSPQYFPNESEVIVAGCREDKYIDAIMVILKRGDGSVLIYKRDPLLLTYTCPLP